MAITYTTPSGSTWINGDQLKVRFPAAANTPTRGGSISKSDGNMAEFFITLADLPATSGNSNGLVVADNVRIPAGAFIEKVEVMVTKEPTDASGTANLDLGTCIAHGAAGVLTGVDSDGFLAAADLFSAGTDLGTIVTYDTLTTESGVRIGTVLAADYLVTASYDTAAFTGGVIRVRIFWTVLRSEDD